MLFRIIPTALHGVLDYVVGMAFLVLPVAMGWDGSAVWLFWLLGFGTLVYSLMTRYEYGWVKVLSMRMHLMLDMGGGLLLLWAAYYTRTSNPDLQAGATAAMVGFGLFELMAALISSPEPPVEYRQAPGEVSDIDMDRAA